MRNTTDIRGVKFDQDRAIIPVPFCWECELQIWIGVLIFQIPAKKTKDLFIYMT